jgi:hypothetical protein
VDLKEANHYISVAVEKMLRPLCKDKTEHQLPKEELWNQLALGTHRKIIDSASPNVRPVVKAQEAFVQQKVRKKGQINWN